MFILRGSAVDLRQGLTRRDVLRVGLGTALGMAGIYTPVPAYYKWIGDEGLTPRKDIKQGWAWLSMTALGPRMTLAESALPVVLAPIEPLDASQPSVV